MTFMIQIQTTQNTAGVSQQNKKTIINIKEKN